MFKDFLAHKEAGVWFGESGKKEAHSILALVDISPDFEDIESSLPGGVLERRKDFDSFVDLDSVIGAIMKLKQLLCLLNSFTGTGVGRSFSLRLSRNN